MDRAFSLSLFACLAACTGASGAGSGSLDVYVLPEETISDGLVAGDGDENLRDGWNVTYTRFLVSLGHFSASVSTMPDQTLSEESIHVVDLERVTSSGFLLAQFNDVRATRWDRVGFRIPNADANTVCSTDVEADACSVMKSEGLSLWIAGTVTKDGAEPLQFDWKLTAGTDYADCENGDGILGFAVPDGGSQQIELSVHGDHWFFTRYPTGDESIGAIHRCASWMELADGADGTAADRNISIEELQHLDASVAFPTSSDAGLCRYDLGAFPHPVATAYDYVVQMARSLGHFQGEGDCLTRNDLN